MRVDLAYGRDGLAVDLPDGRTTVVTPRFRPGVADPAAALRQALRRPLAGPRLREIARPGQRVAVSVCDITRAQPREPMLRALLEELEGVVRPEDVSVLVATGTHRANTPAELEGMLGRELATALRVVNHDARDDGSLVDLGPMGDAVPVFLNREWLEADLRITTGFVEPHFFAGFSGGPKMIAPGLAGLETVLTLHDARRIGHPKARWGILHGNPVHDDVRAIARATGCHFGFDVVLNARQEITRAFAGELFAMHEAACAEAKRVAMAPVAQRFEVVVTTNSGYPLDQNLYQAVKGMSAAAEVVADGGLIVCAAECRDGLPDHGAFAELLASAGSPAELLARVEEPGHRVPDQWQVQVQARIQQRARVLVKSDFLGADQLRAAHLGAVDDVGAAVREALEAAGPAARVCALPEGPQTIPYLA